MVVRNQDGRDQLASATRMLLHSLTKKVNLKEEAVTADASQDHAVTLPSFSLSRRF
jgi:hypothetical protein